ncbi:uncharacterized protein LOC127788544 [Diospyros lotus]|uniref:uncharacterized protein LOC127788544 n=1 Tax=Diospyros lotus TaxID=55363 RepID=UPI0022598107|nr:uncharacterized protein LOC127788544 [Diospyros lotus]
MPQVDLETLVSACAGGDRKIACETLAGGEGEKQMKEEEEEDLPPDFPPESFWLSKDAEFDWFDRNAFYERKDSTKGASNSGNLNPHSNSSSQRFSKNFRAKAAIIGLPKTQKTSYVDTTKRRNCRPPNIRLFPKRSGSVGKSAAPMTEPSSPKVSCMGRVRSKRCRRKASEATPATNARKSERRRSGLFGSCMSLFQSRRRNKPAVRTDDPPATTVESPPRRNVTAKSREFPVSVEPAAEPPSLGGVKRFASGRRSMSWGSDSDVSNGHL